MVRMTEFLILEVAWIKHARASGTFVSERDYIAK